MKQKLIEEFKRLGIQEIMGLQELHLLKGDFINLECRLPNGQTAKLLDDSKMYYGAEVCKKYGGRCYGLAGDAEQLLVYEYGDGGTEVELVIWKKLCAEG